MHRPSGWPFRALLAGVAIVTLFAGIGLVRSVVGQVGTGAQSPELTATPAPVFIYEVSAWCVAECGDLSDVSDDTSIVRAIRGQAYDKYADGFSVYLSRDDGRLHFYVHPNRAVDGTPVGCPSLEVPDDIGGWYLTRQGTAISGPTPLVVTPDTETIICEAEFIRLTPTERPEP